MKRRLFYLLSLLIIGIFNYLYAQTPFTIKGKVELGEDDFYFVSLLSLPDSVILTMDYFDTADFMVESKNGKDVILYISSSYRYEPYQKEIKNSRNASLVDVGTIHLNANIIELKEVQVISSLPRMRVEEGKQIYSIQNNPEYLSLFSSEEVLKRIPMVSIEDGTVSVFGKKNSIILINGILPKTNEWEYLLPEDIKEIQVITNPSAEYSAGGMAVVNIVTKRKRVEGLNGQLFSSVSKGRNWRGSNTFQGGYATNRLNVYTNATWIPEKKNNRNSYERFFNDGTKIYNFLDQKLTNKKNYKILGGVEYDLSPNHAVSMQYQYLIRNAIYYTLNTNQIAENNECVSFYSSINSEVKSDNHLVDINYNWEIDSIGKKFSIATGYINYSTKEMSGIEENRTDFIQQRFGFSQADAYLYNLNINYTHVTKNNFTGKMGVYYSYNKNLSSYNLETFNPFAETNDDFFSNGADIRERQFATYLTGRKKWNNLSISAGVRFEYVHSENCNRDREKQSITYNDFFPSVELEYQISKDWQAQLGYSRKINRPAFKDLDPSAYYVDTFTYQMGNVNLCPEYAQTFSLNMTYKRMVTFTAGYSHITDPLYMYVKLLTPDSKIGITTRENLNFEKQWSASVFIPYSYRRWTTQNVIGINYKWGEFPMDDEFVKKKKTMAYFYSYQGIKLSSDWNLSVIWNYISAGYNGMFDYEKQHVVNCSVSKTLLKGQLLLNLRYEDVFRNNKQRMSVNYNTIAFNSVFDYDNSYITFSARYTFGKASKKYQVKNNNPEGRKRIR